MSLRIALLHYSAPPVVGGVESVLMHHSRLMVDAGHIPLILAGRGKRWDERIPLISIPIIDSRHPAVLSAKAALDQGRLPLHFEQLNDEIAAALRPVLATTDILIAHNVCSLHKNLALAATLWHLLKEPHMPRFILWHHDLAWTTPRYRPDLYEGYPWNLLRTAWPGVRNVVGSETRCRELASLLNLDPSNITVIPNGIEPELFFKLEGRTRQLARQMQLADSEPILLLPARLTPRKNIELALRIVAALRKGLPKVSLVVTGPEGPHNPANAEYRAQLLALRDELGLRGAAHFIAEYTPEYLPDSIIADFFRLADALLFPSREEGFGIPLLEAGLARLPIFCADIPPLREVGGEDALYFSPEADPAQIASLIREHLQSSPIARFNLRARRDYTWQHIYAKHLAPLLEG